MKNIWTTEELEIIFAFLVKRIPLEKVVKTIKEVAPDDYRKATKKLYDEYYEENH